MRVLLINSVCGIGSTGRICTDLAQQFEADGNEVKIAYGRSSVVPDAYKKYGIQIGNKLSVLLHVAISRIFDAHGFGSYFATRQFIKWLDDFNPDLIWLHNIHGYYINVNLLFKWIKAHPNVEVKWTLHDCWSFTGHCAHFSYNNCDKWKRGCEDCRFWDEYPSAICSNSSRNYLKKKDLFTGVSNMTIITPSKWLASLVRSSFLNNYNIQVLFNDIDTTVFKPTKSDFRQRYGLEDKKILLGVSSIWSEKKGFSTFIELNQLLDHSRYVIVLVGLSVEQIKNLPQSIIGIAKTNSAIELAEIYSTADLFINPTKEDNYPTVNLEAEACGTPVLTNDVGGCSETIAMAKSRTICIESASDIIDIIERFY